MKKNQFRVWDSIRNEYITPSNNHEIVITSNGDVAIAYRNSSETPLKFLNDTIIEFYTNLNDEDNNLLFENDILFCEKALLKMKSDYIPKKYTTYISAYLLVEFFEGKYCFKFIKPIDEHKEAFDNFNYRDIRHLSEPLAVHSKKYNPNTKQWDIQGDGITCYNVKKIGNKNQNPEYLNSEKLNANSQS